MFDDRALARILIPGEPEVIFCLLIVKIVHDLLMYLSVAFLISTTRGTGGRGGGV